MYQELSSREEFELHIIRASAPQSRWFGRDSERAEYNCHKKPPPYYYHYYNATAAVTSSIRVPAATIPAAADDDDDDDGSSSSPEPRLFQQSAIVQYPISSD
jgi:hypothetical protein